MTRATYPYRPAPGALPKSAVVRDEGFDYNTATGFYKESGSYRFGITATSAPRPERFTWGKVLRVHVVGDDYAIVEYTPYQASNVSDEDYDPSPTFSIFIRGAHGGTSWNCGHSFHSLDAALIGCIAWRAEQRTHGLSKAMNSQAVGYISQMLELDR